MIATGQRDPDCYACAKVARHIARGEWGTSCLLHGFTARPPLPDLDALIARVRERNLAQHVQRYRLREDIADLQTAVLAIEELRQEIERLRSEDSP